MKYKYWLNPFSEISLWPRWFEQTGRKRGFGQMPDQSSKRESVLIVEDEAIQRMAAADGLQIAGFAALGAASAERAIELLTERDDIRAVVTDVSLGKMTGLELAGEVRRRWPMIDIIIVSGQEIPRAQLPSRSAFLLKPYRLADVIATLQTLIEQRQNEPAKPAQPLTEERPEFPPSRCT